MFADEYIVLLKTIDYLDAKAFWEILRPRNDHRRSVRWRSGVLVELLDVMYYARICYMRKFDNCSSIMRWLEVRCVSRGNQSFRWLPHTSSHDIMCSYRGSSWKCCFQRNRTIFAIPKVPKVFEFPKSCRSNPYIPVNASICLLRCSDGVSAADSIKCALHGPSYAFSRFSDMRNAACLDMYSDMLCHFHSP